MGLQVDTSRTLGSQWYTPIGMREDSDPAEFLLEPLSNDAVVGIQVMRAGPAKVRETIRAGVRDWRGVHDEKGDPLEFDVSLLFRRGAFPQELLFELFSKIWSLSVFTEDDRKNS